MTAAGTAHNKTAKVADIMDSAAKGSQDVKKINCLLLKKKIDIKRCKEDNFFAEDIISFYKMSPIAGNKSHKYRATKKQLPFGAERGGCFYNGHIYRDPSMLYLLTKFV